MDQYVAEKHELSQAYVGLVEDGVEPDRPLGLANQTLFG